MRGVGEGGGGWGRFLDCYAAAKNTTRPFEVKKRNAGVPPVVMNDRSMT